nr:hypothetical protein [Tanacetum cinerariifolium]
MFGSSSPEFSRNSLTIKKDDTFFSRLVSKENSVANPSSRVYYGNVSSAVPFTWEIQPGKDTCQHPHPPLYQHLHGHHQWVALPKVMCFRMKNNKIRNQKGGNTAYKLVMMKKAFFAILSRGSG